MHAFISLYCSSHFAVNLIDAHAVKSGVLQSIGVHNVYMRNIDSSSVKCVSPRVPYEDPRWPRNATQGLWLLMHVYTILSDSLSIYSCSCSLSPLPPRSSVIVQTLNLKMPEWILSSSVEMTLTLVRRIRRRRGGRIRREGEGVDETPGSTICST